MRSFLELIVWPATAGGIILIFFGASLWLTGCCINGYPKTMCPAPMLQMTQPVKPQQW